ncbi:MAG: primosomal protein N', partial [Hyphomonadaceae bacterium]|nr:primosomal protein N' [Clostridia bacterium]
MKEIAQVVVNHPSYMVDKIFHYAVPEPMKPLLDIGMRVIVPFGQGNHTAEAYVLGFQQSTEFKRIKDIAEVVDKKPLFDENMLALIQWMRTTYLTTWYEAIRIVLPPGITLKKQEYVSCLVQKLPAGKWSEAQVTVFDAIQQNGGQIALLSLMFTLQLKTLRTTIKTLEKKGILAQTVDFVTTVKEKTVNFVSLTITIEEAVAMCQKLEGKAAAQVRMLEILIDNESVSVADLILFADTGHQTLRTLLNKGWVSTSPKTIMREPFELSSYTPTTHFDPTQEQKAVLKFLNEKLLHPPQTVLLRGVTGSGKTEVYLQLIDQVLRNGKQAIVMVPEISLTPQMIGRFVGRFGERVAVVHSGLSLGERFDQWQKIRQGVVSVAIGARSAVFAPFDQLGLLILDEEHEYSYKSENSPRYHAREVAEFRAKQCGGMVLLSSATPSVDSYVKAKNGRYSLIEMTKRYNDNALPTVEIVDMRAEIANGNKSIFSEPLKQEIALNIKNKEQVILFLNRRGFSAFITCRSCGITLMCPHCHIAMSYHSRPNKMICHYCGVNQKVPKLCPTCESTHIRHFGVGTEQVEQALGEIFPTATVLRMDTDTTGGKMSHKHILQCFEQEQIDILIGTQMVSKGLDFPNVTLVGVMAADMSLGVDDYRADERTFQLLTQVCGRAGRGDLHGRAVIQTYQPEHDVLALAKTQDYVAFYQKEIHLRKMLYYPPYCHLVVLIVSGRDEEVVRETIVETGLMIKQQVFFQKNEKFPVLYLGPLPAPVAKIKNQLRFRLMIKCNATAEIRENLHTVLVEMRKKVQNK